MIRWLFLLGGFALFSTCFAQEAQKPDSCWNLLQKAGLANELGNYEYALLLYDSSLLNCKGKMAIIDCNTGKARAFNGLQRYAEAIQAAQTALKNAQNKSYTALFERSDAYFATGKTKEGNADYTLLESRSIASTNPKEKAFLLSKLARLNWQLQKKSLAYQQVAKAISLDPANASFYILQGDFNAADKKLKDALGKYEMALTHHADQQLVLKKKAVAYTAIVQAKYQVHDAKELKIKLGISEKLAFCTYWKDLFNTGYTNKQEELYFTLICL